MAGNCKIYRRSYAAPIRSRSSAESGLGDAKPIASRGGQMMAFPVPAGSAHPAGSLMLLAPTPTRKMPQSPAIVRLGRWRGRITAGGDGFANFRAASLFVTIGFPARPLPIPCSALRELPRKSLVSIPKSALTQSRSRNFPASREIAARLAATAYRPARGAPNTSSAVLSWASCAVPSTFGLIGRSSSASRRGGGTAPLLPLGAKAPAAFSAPDRSLS